MVWFIGHSFCMCPSRSTTGPGQRVRHAPEGRLCHRVLGGSRRRCYNWLLYLTTGESSNAYATQGGLVFWCGWAFIPGGTVTLIPTVGGIIECSWNPMSQLLTAWNILGSKERTSFSGEGNDQIWLRCDGGACQRSASTWMHIADVYRLLYTRLCSNIDAFSSWNRFLAAPSSCA